MRRICLISLTLVGIAGTLQAATITVTTDGAPASRIVIGAEAAESVSYAAEELQTYIKKISGAELPIVHETPDDLREGIAPGIYLGDSRAAARLRITVDRLDPDGFRIATPERGLMIITGRDHKGPHLPGRSGSLRRSLSSDGRLVPWGETGTLYGVYHLLRELGCRWFFPGDIGEVVPQQSTIRFSDYAVTDAPHFHYRMWYAFDWDKDAEAARWYKRVGFGGEYYINLNHSFTDWAAKYGETNPEYFATVRGKRDIYNHKEPGRVSINFTNPDVLDLTVQQARDFFEQPPWQTDEPIDWDRQIKNFPIYPIVPNDSYTDAGQEARDAGWVTEERGTSGMFSDLVWNFVNEVAKQVKDDYPDRYIGSLAYAYQFLPPQRIERLEDNVVVMICKTRRNHWDRDYKEKIRAAIDGWLALKPAKVYVWEYYNVWYNPAMRGVPVVFPHLVDEDIKFLADISSGEFVESESETRDNWGQSRVAQHVGLQGLNWYVTARLLWDPHQDLDVLLDDYYTRFYGPAQEPMRQVFTYLEGLWLDPSRHSDQPWRTMMTPSDVTLVFRWLREARRLAHGTEYEPRVEWMLEEFEIVRNESERAARWEEPPTLIAPKIAAPEIDAQDADAAWQGVEPITMVGNNTGDLEELSPQFTIGHDSERLYLSVRIPRTPGKPVMAEVHEDGGAVWMDEGVEIFFEPTGTWGKTYQIVISATGAVYDRSPKDADLWSSGVQTATRVEDDEWLLEAAIPLAAIDAPLPTAEKPWLFDVMVNRWEGEPKAYYHAWAPTFGLYNSPSRFGKLVLGE